MCMNVYEMERKQEQTNIYFKRVKNNLIYSHACI